MHYLIQFKDGTLSVLDEDDILSEDRGEGTNVKVQSDGKEFDASIIESSTEKPTLVDKLKDLVRKREAERRLNKMTIPSVVAGTSRYGRERLPTETKYGWSATSESEISQTDDDTDVDGPLLQSTMIEEQEQLPSNPPIEFSERKKPADRKVLTNISDDIFKERVLKQLAHIRAELVVLRETRCNCNTETRPRTNEPNETRFSTLGDVVELQHLLTSMTASDEKELVSWLCTAGGNNILQATRNVVNMLFTHDLQLQVNKTGKGEKISVKKLFPPMIAAVKILSKANGHEAEQAISRYLSGAHDRYGGRKRRIVACKSADAAD